MDDSSVGIRRVAGVGWMASRSVLISIRSVWQMKTDDRRPNERTMCAIRFPSGDAEPAKLLHMGENLWHIDVVEDVFFSCQTFQMVYLVVLSRINFGFVRF